MPKTQRHMMDEASRRIAEANETFLELLPTMRRKELEKLIEKRPALWGRFAGYLTSGHVFVDDPPAGIRHATRKKSPAQLDREIADALAGRRSHATRDLSAVEDALGYTPELGVVERAETAYGDYSTNELRREVQSLEDQFEMSGGRGVGLADRLDAARVALALRGSKKRTHAAKARGVLSHLDDDLPMHDRPLAAKGLTSYRLRGPYGYIMIGARDHEDAMREAARSTRKPDRAALEVWNGDRYVKAFKKR